MGGGGGVPLIREGPLNWQSVVMVCSIFITVPCYISKGKTKDEKVPSGGHVHGI